MARLPVRLVGVVSALAVAFHTVKLSIPDLKSLEASVANDRRHDHQRSSDATAATADPPPTLAAASYLLEIDTNERNDVVHLNDKSEDRSISQPEAVLRPAEAAASPVHEDSTPTGSIPDATESLSLDAPGTPNPPQEDRTLAFKQKRFASGFRNAGMAFTWFVMYAGENNYTSILLNNLNWKDLYGLQKPWGFAPHNLLFDVEHWNSHYPVLPRIVAYDPHKHDQYDPVTMGSASGVAEDAATRPYFAGTYMQGFNQYRMYTKRVLNDPIKHPRSPAETAMMQGAFRPSQAMQAHMDRLTGGDSYLALLARIEPDMQNHPVCRDKKVLLLSDIVSNLEAQFPQPDFGRVFVATNRPMLEYEATNKLENWVAAANLKELNRIRDDGMWNGTVKVFEAGSNLMRHSGDDFQTYSGISGAVIDYFLALQSSVFVGTEVSSFSADLIQSRFFRDNRRNYHYRPDGLALATGEADVQPPRFAC
jgi:hypothetical protein